MHIKGSGGFDAEKFQKLVAMLDSPSTGEVANAFRLAIAELKKRLKFVDQTGSSAEAIKVQLECEAARLDLQKELNTTKRKGASSDELKATIERLYRRISMLEEAASYASQGQPPEPDWADEYLHEDPVEPKPPQQQTVQPNSAPPKPVHETPPLDNFTPEDDYVYPDPDPKQHAVATLPLNASRPSTIGPAFIARLKLVPRVEAFYASLVVIMLYFIYFTDPNKPHPLLLAIMLFLMFSAFAWIMVSTFRRYGKDGIILKLCLLIDALIICLTIGYGRDPFSWSIYHRSLWAPHQALSAIFLILAIVAIAFLPEGTIYWLLDVENDTPQKWVVYPAALAVVFAIAMHFDPALFQRTFNHATDPAPAVTHHTSHHHTPHPVAFQIENTSVVYASNGSPVSSSDSSGLVLLPFAGVAILFLIGSRNRAKARKERAAAQQAAHDFQAPNVHGNAGYALKSDVRRKGWL